jgi:hypothetical protein
LTETDPCIEMELETGAPIWSFLDMGSEQANRGSSVPIRKCQTMASGPKSIKMVVTLFVAELDEVDDKKHLGALGSRR